jgi:selenide,water dikinase
MEKADDAGVYRISDDLALVQTLDFFTPIVDDPYDFGQVAAANSLSDIYAMGGRPLTAMNIVCFPAGKLSTEVLRRILRGGLDKLREANVALVGGHSVDDPELKFGMAVTGLIRPEAVLTNLGAMDGDRLVLTKPLGTGIVNTALKGGMASPAAARQAVSLMAMLNRKAAEIMAGFTIHAATDVTGFGLIGHTAEMIQGTGLGIRFMGREIPLIDEAAQYADYGMLPGGLHRNRQFWKHLVQVDAAVPQWLDDLVHDPQTSGGLLLACPAAEADGLASALRSDGHPWARVIGEFTRDPHGLLHLTY